MGIPRYQSHSSVCDRKDFVLNFNGISSFHPSASSSYYHHHHHHHPQSVCQDVKPCVMWARSLWDSETNSDGTQCDCDPEDTLPDSWVLMKDSHACLLRRTTSWTMHRRKWTNNNPKKTTQRPHRKPLCLSNLWAFKKILLLCLLLYQTNYILYNVVYSFHVTHTRRFNVNCNKPCTYCITIWQPLPCKRFQ